MVRVGAVGAAIASRSSEGHLAQGAAQGLLEGYEKIGFYVLALMGKRFILVSTSTRWMAEGAEAVSAAAEERFKKVAEAGAVELEVALTPLRACPAAT